MRAVIAAVLVLAVAGCARRAPDTAAEAFKDICVDTHAAPDAVAKAAGVAGATSAPAIAGTTGATVTQARFWTLTLTSGVSASISQVVDRPREGERDESCGIVVQGSDPASIKEVRTWIADKADPPYRFRDLDARQPVTSSAEADAARREDRLWTLTVLDEGSAAYFNISHERPDR
ncbi:MAG TPA: hypothetical protein VG407_10165 [Caulobacteraceae bacterium]|jgi:hypothetical protein|nr:hypothetical protein [Caulobacteraceae bacterium]